MSPAIDAAMATTVPTVSAPILPASSVQPMARKTAEVPSREAIVMPLVGFEVTPTSPTIRDDTVTKKNAKITTQIAATDRLTTLSSAPKAWGTNASIRNTATAPTIVTVNG